MARDRHTRRQILGTFALAVLATPVLAACSSPSTQSSAAPPATQPTQASGAQTASTPAPNPAASAPASANHVDLVWYQYNNWNGKTGTEANGKPDDYINWQAQEFMKLHPNVTLKAYNFPQDLGTKIDASLAAGHPISTTFTQGQGIAHYGLLGVLSTVDDFVKQEDITDYLPGTYEEMSLSGKHYGYPYRLSPGGGILINADLFKERGVEDLLPGNKDPNNPAARTWSTDDFLKAAKATTFSRSNGSTPDVYGCVLMGTEYTYQLDAFLLSYGAEFWNEDLTKVTLNNDIGVEALTWLADLELTQKVAAPGTAGRGMQASLTFFQGGQAAIVPISIGSHWKQLANAAKNGTWAKAFALWGGLPPNKPPSTAKVETNVYGYIVFKQKDHDMETWGHTLAQYLSDKDHVLLAAQNGYPPVRKSLIDAIKSDFILLEATTVGTTFAHTFGKLAQVSEPDPQLYQAVFSGKQTAKEALSDFEKRATTKLQEAYKLLDQAKAKGNS